MLPVVVLELVIHILLPRASEKLPTGLSETRPAELAGFHSTLKR